MYVAQAIDQTLVERAADAREARLALAGLRLTLKNIEPGQWVMPAFGGLLCFIFSNWFETSALFTWLGAVILCALSAALLRGRFAAADVRPENASRWILALTAHQFAFNSVWAGQAFFFWVPGDHLNHMIVLLVLASSLAAGAALASPCDAFKYPTFVPFGGIAVLRTALEAEPIYLALCAATALYVLYQFHMFRQMNANARAMLSLREDKSDLIERLEGARLESDRARVRAETASRAKSDFLANMSHELRTPLNAIIGFSEMMKLEALGPMTNPTYKSYAGDIHNSGLHLLGLINDILDLSRIEAGRFQISPEDLNLKTLAVDTLRMFDIRARNGGISLVCDVEDDLLLHADNRGLRQVMLNLVSNAVKFTPTGGTVTLFGRRNAQGGAEFGVRDTGVGIPQKDVDLVFENFGQAQHEIKVMERGTGLGLPIVKGIITVHSGVVRLESTLGQGTTVTCYLPVSRVRRGKSAA